MGMGGCICCTVCCFAISIIVFISLSLSSLPVNTYGLDYSPIMKTVNPVVFDSGFHYLGFMHKFLEYPSQIMSVDFSDESGNDRGPIESRSTDGLQVKFSVQFQYTLNKGSLIDLYQRYGDDYRSPCIRYAVDVLNDRATNFTASQFFQDLGTVQEDMRKAIVAVWDAECFATITTVQVSKAKLPVNYENSLQATQLASQAGITASQTQNNTVIDMTTKIKQAEIAAPIVINQAEAKVNATLATNLAQMQSYQAVTKSESNAYKAMKAELGFSADDQLLNYIKVKTVNTFNPSNLYLSTVPKSNANKGRR